MQGLTLCDGDKVSVDSLEIRTIPRWPSVASCRSEDHHMYIIMPGCLIVKCRNGNMLVRNSFAGLEFIVDKRNDKFVMSKGHPR